MVISTPRLLRRRNKLLQLTERFGAARLADDIGTPRSHISALSKGHRGIGDVLAGKLDQYAVENFGKEPGWIDANGDDEAVSMPFRDLDPFESQLVTLFRRLPSKAERDSALVELSRRVESAPLLGTWPGEDRRHAPNVGHVPERRIANGGAPQRVHAPKKIAR